MNEPPIEIKRKPKLRWWWFLFIPVFVIGMIVVQAIGPNPPIQIGRETTYLSDPLDEQGMPDYAQYLMTNAAEGVTHESNAAVLIWQAAGLDRVEEQYRQSIVDALEIGWPTQVVESPYSTAMKESVTTWVSERNPDVDAETLEQLQDEIIELAMGRPWSPGELPLVDAWAEDNRESLELLVEGASRPKYFFPPPNLAADEDVMLFSVLLPDLTLMREMARALKLRATWHISHQRYGLAWRDLLATYRLSRHCGGKNAFLVSCLVGVAIEAMAHESLQALLSEDLPTELLAQIRDEFRALPPRKRMWEVYQEGERFGALDALTRLAQGRNQDVSMMIDSTGQLAAVAGNVRIDWNISLRAANNWYDRMTEATKLPFAERKEALERIDDELSSLNPLGNPSRMLHGIVSTRARSELVSDVMLSLLLPASHAAVRAEDRADMYSNLIDISIALAQYRSEHASYPETLDAIVPRYLARIPNDLYHSDRPRYERRAEGYLIYSVFENGMDDGGTSFVGDIVRGEHVNVKAKVDLDRSDLVIRLPMPRFKLPPVLLSDKTDDGSSDGSHE